ncbi:hypothetical protein [Aquimarina sediminis]|uniref:hypothetical protein n=1 Tax=Aquimarina sediminis TaxID=2070536 RepID=UPI000CA01826|nr:hypothetical protein [Aquimarina sediminis]
MNKATFTILLFSISLSNLLGQTNSINVPQNIRLPKDSITSDKLIRSFQNFLDLKEKPNHENTLISSQNFIETSALLDELKGIEKSFKYKDDNFYKCYINNVIQLNNSNYLIQFHYSGVHKNQPLLRANYTIVAQETDDQFYFYSPLQQNTSSWKAKTIENYTFYFKDHFDLSKATAYTAKIAEYDSILHIPKQATKLYCAENFNEVLKLIGIDFKLDYNGYSYNTLQANENGNSLIVDGILASNYKNFDPHDLWHSRVRKILPSNKIYKPVDEGCAFIYGGSWGYTWEEILHKFKVFITSNPKSDWLELYNNGKNFGDEKNKALRVDYMLNALLIQKINKDQGFSTVLKLLSCGKTNEEYFPLLETVTGITKSNFNRKISKLISQIK